MAAIIGILDWHQPATAIPSRFSPRHKASRLCRRGWAEKLRPDLIRLRREREIAAPRRLRIGYIPKSLPAAEIQGCIFDGPTPEHQSLYLARARVLAGGRAGKILAGSRTFIGYVSEKGQVIPAREVLAGAELPAGTL